MVPEILGSSGSLMNNNSKTRFLPVVIFAASMPAILLPVMRSFDVPDFVMGFTIGSSLGLAILGLFWMIKGNRDCSAAARHPE